MTVVHLTEAERRFVLGAVRAWSGRYDPFGQALIAKLETPDNQEGMAARAGEEAGGRGVGKL